MYILELRSKKGKVSYYTGQTNDFKRRLEEHITGILGARYTKGREVIRFGLGYVITRTDAIKKEKAIKKWKPERKKNFVDEYCLTNIMKFLD